LLGTLFDQDFTYVNGKQVGHTGYQYPPRRYDIPEGLLQEGDNVITIRFVNKYGMVHFIKEKPYLLAFGEDRFSQNPMPADIIPLSTEWKHHAGVQMPSCPSADVSLQNLPTTLYNAVLHPLAPYALSGVVWYQGESNAGNPAPYADYLRKMMGCWRDRWQNQKMPFVIVQLANYMEPSDRPQESGWAALREAQRIVAKEDPNAELACIIDLGETVDIHPLRKWEVAQRVARGFDRMLWHPKTLLSPEPVSATAEGGDIVLTLDQPLRPVADGLNEFEVAAADGRFMSAQARADGNRIVITSPVDAPATIRYAWKNNPLRANAFSLEGLPLVPFQLKLEK
jgi:sialate O-acetylesterase